MANDVASKTVALAAALLSLIKGEGYEVAISTIPKGVAKVSFTLWSSA